MIHDRIVISSGHGKHVRGAHGIIDEVDEARRVVDAVAEGMRQRGVEVFVFHDDVSETQNENLNRIVNYHNAQSRDLDVSVHFNAFEQTSKPRGTEVLFVTQGPLASQVAAAIADCGLVDRGGKKRTDLFFLNNTDMPAILIEVCFVDSEADTDVYDEQFDAICDAIVTSVSGLADDAEPPAIVPPPATPRVDIEVSGNVLIFVNGQQIGTAPE
jgi:N-acetylmuramoyl-L-alanine amidase